MRPFVSALLGAALLSMTAASAAAETDAQWQPNAFNRISKCRPLWIKLGDVPVARDPGPRDTTFVCHVRFALSHDNVSKTPDWVLEKITRRQISGNNPRPGGFVQEKRVKPSHRARDDDYPPEATGFDRGHMAPAEDFNFSLPAMKRTFVLSNAVPQRSSFNRGVWGQLEDRVRDVAYARREIHVITGPVRRTGNVTGFTLTAAQGGCGHEIRIRGPEAAFVCKANNRNPRDPCRNWVAVPLAVYKIVYDANADEVYAFLLPNIEQDTGGDTLQYLNRFRVTVGAIEQLTGLQFFKQKPQAQQEKLVDRCEANVFWADRRPEPRQRR